MAQTEGTPATENPQKIFRVGEAEMEVNEGDLLREQQVHQKQREERSEETTKPVEIDKNKVP